MKLADNESLESGSTTVGEESYGESISQKAPETESKKEEIPQKNGETPASEAVSTPNLRSSANDAIVMKLIKTRKIQCKLTEEYALDYVTQLHHPAISCFREIRKSDLTNIFSNNKWKRHISEPVEQSIVYMGIIDYIGTALNNPLYEDNFSKTFAKGGLQTVQKIMMDFKSMIANWSLSEKDTIKKRCEAIMKHLRQLVPLFAAAGQDFESVLDCIESDIVRIKANQERIKTSFPEDIKDNSKPPTSEPVTDDRFALGEIILNFGANDDKAKTPVSSSSTTTPVSTSSKSKSKFRPAVNTKSPATGNKQASKSKAKASLLQNQKPSNSPNATKRPIPESNSPLNESSAKKIKKSQPSSTTEGVESEDSKVDCAAPTPKPVNATSPSLVIGEKKINAFALLMNKSREIAQANKLKKIAAEAKVATRAVV